MKILVMSDDDKPYGVKTLQPYFKHVIKVGDIVDLKLPKWHLRYPRKMKKKHKKMSVDPDFLIYWELSKKNGGTIGPGFEEYLDKDYEHLGKLTEQDIKDMFDSLIKKQK